MAWVYHNKPPMGWPLDLSEPINDGLVGYWYMPEGSGNKVQDLSGNGLNGTLSGNAAWVSSKYGSAINFPAGVAASNIQVPTSPLLGADSTQMTWIFALKPTAIADNGGIFRKYFSAVGHRSYVIRYSGIGGDLDLIISADGTNISINHPGAGYVTDGMHLYAISWNASRATDTDWYKDGVLFSSTDNGEASLFDVADDLYIGSGLAAGDSVDGDIAFAMIFNRALSASEIALLYRFPFYGFLNPDEIPVLDQYYTVAGGIVVLRRRIEAA